VLNYATLSKNVLQVKLKTKIHMLIANFIKISLRFRLECLKA